MAQWIGKFAAAFLSGAFLMLLMSFTVYRKSYYYQKARAENLDMPERPVKGSHLVTLLILLVMILFLAVAVVWIAGEESAGFRNDLLYSLALVSSLSLFDALVIDWLILAIWQPAFLLPEGLHPSREAMRHHIRRQLTFGWVFKLPMAFLAAGLAALLKIWL